MVGVVHDTKVAGEIPLLVLMESDGLIFLSLALLNYTRIYRLIARSATKLGASSTARLGIS